MGGTGPDEAMDIVRDIWVGVEEFILKRFQVFIDHLEPQLKGRIDHAAGASHHRLLW
jgi:hypothetical protein